FFYRNAHKIWPFGTLPSRGYWYIRRTLRHIEAQLAPMLPRSLLRVFRSIFWLLRKLADFRRSFQFFFRQVARAWHLLSPWHFVRERSPFERRLARSQRLHTWACGDFTLAARDDWFHLRGYPEWPMYSWHIDSAFMFAANAHEIREIALGSRYRIYHIDHSVGSGWSPSGQEQLFSRLNSQAIPFLSYDERREWQIRAAKTPADVIINLSDWGLAAFDLPERSMSPRGCNQ